MPSLLMSHMRAAIFCCSSPTASQDGRGFHRGMTSAHVKGNVRADGVRNHASSLSSEGLGLCPSHDFLAGDRRFFANSSKAPPPPCFDLWDLRMPWTRSSVSRKSGGTGTERKTRSPRFFRERKTIVPLRDQRTR